MFWLYCSVFGSVGTALCPGSVWMVLVLSVLGEPYLRVGLALFLATDLQGPAVVLGGLLQPASGRAVPGPRVQTQTQEETRLLPQTLWGEEEEEGEREERQRGGEGDGARRRGREEEKGEGRK